MSIPYTFQPGTTISSSEVNANFDYILGSIIGGVLTDEVQFLKDIVFGSRMNMVLGGAHDTGGSTTRKFTMLSWNAKYLNQGGGVYTWDRINDGENATVAKVGRHGFEVATTSTTSGALDKQLNTVFSVTPTSGVNTDYFYFAKGWSFQTKDGSIDSIEDYRNTVVWLENDTAPLDLVGSNSITKNKGTWVIDLRENGASMFAKSVILIIYGRGGPSASACRIYQERVTRNKALGISLFCDAGKENQVQGDIVLGRGPRAGQLVIENTASFTSLSILVQGYTI